MNPTDPDERVVAFAAEAIRAGRLVAFPTETVYGLGADGLNVDAVERAYAVKGRPRGRGLILHVASRESLPRLAGSLPAAATALAEEFWPGPLTLIVARGASVPRVTCGGGEKVAVRAPDHPVAQALIRAAETPIAAPSANVSGRLSPTTARHVLADLEGAVDVVLDGGRCPLGMESTVVDVVESPARVLRPGAVPVDDIERVVGEVVVATDADGGRRYAPSVRLVLVEGGPEALAEVIRAESAEGRRVGLLAGSEGSATAGCEMVTTWGERGGATGLGRTLFDEIRELEEAGAEVIVVEAPREDEAGEAVLHRLRSAATGIVRGRYDGGQECPPARGEA